jgi:hypothetical protein
LDAANSKTTAAADSGGKMKSESKYALVGGYIATIPRKISLIDDKKQTRRRQCQRNRLEPLQFG